MIHPQQQRAYLLSIILVAACGSANGNTAANGSVSAENLGNNGYSVSASFRSPGESATAGCSSQTIGSCTVTSIASCTQGNVDGGQMMSPAAGAITITGGVDSPITLSPEVDGSYRSASGNGAFFRGGESLRIEATGDSTGVPSFSGVVQAPTPVFLNAPLFPSSPQRLGVPRNAPLTFTWAGQSAGVVGVTISSGNL